MSHHLRPFALWTALPSSLAGRNPCDYYGRSVTRKARTLQAIPRSSLPYVTA